MVGRSGRILSCKAGEIKDALVLGMTVRQGRADLPVCWTWLLPFMGVFAVLIQAHAAFAPVGHAILDAFHLSGPAQIARWQPLNRGARPLLACWASLQRLPTNTTVIGIVVVLWSSSVHPRWPSVQGRLRAK
jgi:hypothetical protein